ncbi:MAG: hypothetical protein P8125_00765, partial [Gemmatimonadota bacterium]
MANGGSSGAGDSDRAVAGEIDDQRYPAFQWRAAPDELIRGASQSAGRGTAIGSGGDPIEVRAGAPFARLGSRVLTLTNSP